ncbi:tRNA(Glu)-specific nuclease WapA precursor [Planctomycetes bacterium Poly30]|uniref:tRNA(Glu)-specific nuclease WapA n=1 Tax=Saltatorellus ferox TaxID=2528018 RepID=A0A518ENE3_9BACT|nr:tRNA(Glu)-specific nuclease WapA precursor [Planctomycetes bacterium Poly30]
MLSPQSLPLAAAAAFALSAVSLAQSTTVSVMPGYPNAPHLSPEERFFARENASVVLWGNVNQGLMVGAGATYEWVLSTNGNVSVTTDGSLAGTVTDAAFIPEEVSFALLNQSTREVVEATLIVDDGVNGSSQSTVELLVVGDTDPSTDDPVERLRLDARSAVQEGMRYLYRSQLSDGEWRVGIYGTDAATGFCLWAIQNQGHSLLNNPVEDIFAPVVERGFSHIFRNFAVRQASPADLAAPRATAALGATADGVSDLNQNGQTVRLAQLSKNGYRHPINTAAIVASLAPDHVVTEGELAGMTFKEIVEDAVDYLGANQNAGDDAFWAGTVPLFVDGRGGWNYEPASSVTRSDMSINSWAYIAMEGAIEVFGVEVPAWIKKEVEYTIIGHMKNEVGNVPFGYLTQANAGVSNQLACTGGGLTGMVLAETGVDPGDTFDRFPGFTLPDFQARRENALRYLGFRWADPGAAFFGGGNRGNYYVMWTVSRSLRATARALGLPEGENVLLENDGVLFDWETGASPGSTTVPMGAREGYWSYLVRTQDSANPDVNFRGRWTQNANQVGSEVATALSVLVLTRNVFLDPCPDLVSIPLESVEPFDGSSFEAGVPFTLTGRVVRAGSSRPIVAVEINGSPVDSLDAAGQFFKTITLEPGTNAIAIEAFDSCGSEVNTIHLEGTEFGQGIDSYGDVSTLLTLDYRNTTFSQANQWLIFEASACSQYSAPLPGPFLLVIDTIDNPNVQPVNADGVLADGRPYFAFQAAVNAPALAPGMCTAPRQIIFSNPGLQPFRYETTWLAPGNDAPTFQSTPTTLTGVGAEYRYAARAVDPELSPVSYALLAAPMAAAVDANTGLVTWMPDVADIGVHQFVLEAYDGTVGTARQTWTLEVRDGVGSEPPVFTSAPDVHAAVGSAYAYAASAFDPGGDALVFSKLDGPADLTVSPAGLVEWGFTLPGVHPVALRVTDPSGNYADQGYALAVGTVSGNAHSPSISGNPSLVASAGIPYLYQPLGTDPDPQDVLTFSLDEAPVGMNVNPSTGRVEWLPGVSQAGLVNVALRLEDGAGGYAVQAWTLDVRAQASNSAPVITSLPNRLALLGAPYEYQVEAFDAEEDPVTFEIVSGPAGMTIDATSGLITWTPGIDGPALVALKATDQASSSASFGAQVFTVDVAPINTAPMIVSSPSLDATFGLTYYYDVNALDAELQPLAYSLLEAPMGASINATNGVIVWRPTDTALGAADFEVEVADIFGATATEAFTVLVTDDTEAPEIVVQATPAAARIDEPVSLCVIAADNVGVVSRTLSVNGADQMLSPSGCASVTFTSTGTAQLVATAMDAAQNMAVVTVTLAIVDPNDMELPTIEILAPEPGSLVLGPVNVVANVDDNTPASLAWSVEYRRVDEASWTLLDSGVGAVNGGTLARFDPTMLRNDSYQIRIVANDGVNAPYALAFPVEVAGDYKLGDYTLMSTDLAVPLAGFPMAIQRGYSTLDSRPGDFGPGWMLRLAGSLRDTPMETGDLFEKAYRGDTRVTLTLPNGDLEIFKFQPVSVPFFFLAMAGFVPEGPTGGQLRPALEADTFCALSGGYFFTPFTSYNPDQFIYTDPYGNEFLMQEGVGVQRITDVSGETLTVTEGGIVSSRGPAITFQRDAAGRIERVVGPADDPNGTGAPQQVVTYEYDPATGVLLSTGPEVGPRTEYIYGDANFPYYLTEIRDPSGAPILRNKYSADGLLIAQCGPEGDIDTCEGCIAYDLDAAAAIQTITTAAGDRIELFFSDRGELLIERRWLDATSFFEIVKTYDDEGRILTETLPNNSTTTRTYDDEGRVTAFETADGKIWYQTWSDCGLAARIGPDGDATLYSYDENCRSIGVTRPTGGIEAFAYEADGRAKSVTNPEGGSICLTYDPVDGRLSGFLDQNGAQEVLDVNALGLADTRIDRSGRRVDYTFDEEGRVLREDWDDGNSIVTQYDDAGRETLIEDSVARLEFTYWPAGMIKEVKTTWLSDGAVERVVYGTGDINAPGIGFDLRGNLASVLDSRGGETLYEYDALGRIKSLRWPGAGGGAGVLGGGAGSGSGQAAGVTGKSSAGGPVLAGGPGTSSGGTSSGGSSVQGTPAPEATVQFDWNDPLLGDSWILREVRRIAGSPTDAPSITTRYEYDAEGAPSSLRLIEHLRTSDASQIQFYDLLRTTDGFIGGYTDTLGQHVAQLDGNQRILSVDHPAGPQPDESYTYDLNGNRIASSVDTGYVHDIDDGVGTDRLERTDRFQFTYDALGSMLTMTEPSTAESFEMTYDHRRRIRSITRFDSGVQTRRVELDYDPLGRLIEQRVDGVATRILYEAFNPIVFTDLAGNVIERRLYSRLYDDIHAVARGPELLWPLRDPSGTIREWSSADATSVTPLTYDTFGNLLSGSTAGLPSLGFQSRDRIADLPFYHFRARTYDPRTGRFCQEDQIRPFGYDFAENNPLMFVDPTGESAALEYVCLAGFSIGASTTVANMTKGVFETSMKGVALGLTLGTTGGGGGAGAAAALGREALQNFWLSITVDFAILVIPINLPCAVDALDLAGDVAGAAGAGSGGLKSRLIGNPLKDYLKNNYMNGPGGFFSM